MASFTMSDGPWPPGTVVSLYRGESWPASADAPIGVSLATATVTSLSEVTFADIDEDRAFIAWALGQGVRFRTSPDGLQAPVAKPVRERVTVLEAAVAAIGDGGGGGGTASVQVVTEDVDEGIPDRPDVDLVIWRTWNDPGDSAGPLDLLIPIPEPS